MDKAEDNYRIIQQIQDGRDFLLTMLEQNPSLLKTAEPRIRELFSLRQNENAAQPARSQRGISLIELIVFIVILSVALTGILLVMNQVTAHSADPLIHKQAIAAAESLLEEIELQDFIDGNDGVTTACPPASMVTAANRTDYHIVDCYNGFAMTGITDLNNNPIGLANYNASVAIAPETLNDVAAGSAVRITVTVTDPQGGAIALDGYRTKY